MLVRKKKLGNIESFIDKGAPVRADIESNPMEWTHINTRIPKDLHLELKRILKEERIGMPMNALVVEALYDKVKEYSERR